MREEGLPPLPEFDFHDNGDEYGHERRWGYDPETLQAYARAAIEAEREKNAAKCDRIAWAWDEQRPFAAVAHECAAAIRSGK